MDQAQVFQAVKEIVENYMPRTGAPPSVSLESSLDGLGIDSPRRVDILLDAEDRFKISISDSQFEKVRTFGDLVDLVSALAEGKA